MNIKIKKDSEAVRVPTRGSADAAGYDLYPNISNDITLKIEPGDTVKIGTGLHMEIPEGYFGAVFARSGIATKKGLRPANCVGVIDSDYRGEIIVAIHNDSDEIQEISWEDRIAQIVIMPYLSVTFDVSENLDRTERGEGGFGSTDNKFEQLSLSGTVD